MPLPEGTRCLLKLLCHVPEPPGCETEPKAQPGVGWAPGVSCLNAWGAASCLSPCPPHGQGASLHVALGGAYYADRPALPCPPLPPRRHTAGLAGGCSSASPRTCRWPLWRSPGFLSAASGSCRVSTARAQQAACAPQTLAFRKPRPAPPWVLQTATTPVPLPAGPFPGRPPSGSCAGSASRIPHSTCSQLRVPRARWRPTPAGATLFSALHSTARCGPLHAVLGGWGSPST